MRNTFNFDGVQSSDYGVYISGNGTFDAPERDFEAVEVPGRNGILTLDNGRFQLQRHKYPAFVVPPFRDNVRGLRNALMSKRGAHRLTDTYNTDEFYMAYYERGLEVDPEKNLKVGAMDIIFTRDPRRFLITGETVLTDPATVTNPTLFEARPLIRVYGYGTLTIGDMTVTVALSQYAYIDIDCEMMDCYHEDVNANGYVSFSTGDFPTLPAGTTALSYTNTITKVEVTPHWWRL